MKISLCLIVGNAEDYIIRCLSNFVCLADEVCLVRAIGNQPPDSTLARALAFCQSGDIPLRFAEYLNQPANQHWPHADDFAAARQLSFDLADGEYCFWADTDDVLDPTPTDGQRAAEIVRELAARGGCDAVIMPYRIFGRGVSVPRERLIRNRSGKWRFPVHECFDFTVQPVQSIRDNRVVVVHMPHRDKPGGSERNLRILRSIPSENLTPELLYHLQGELAAAGDAKGSVQVAQRALQSPDLGRAERYEIYLNLSQLAESPAAKTTMLHRAYAADPRRREALALLASHSMDYRENELALAYSRQMLATCPMADPPWNDRAAAYGWLGLDIYSQTLRVNGFDHEAEMARQDILRQAGGPRIALLHSTRGHPQAAALCRKAWLDLAENPGAIEHIFLLPVDDPVSGALQRMHHLILPAHCDWREARKHATAATRAPVLVELTDECQPFPQWDSILLACNGYLTQPMIWNPLPPELGELSIFPRPRAFDAPPSVNERTDRHAVRGP